MSGDPGTVVEFFHGDPVGLQVYEDVVAALATLGPSSVRVSRSQVAFRAARGFAYLWRPDRYLRSTVPVVLSIALPEQVASPRFKEVVHPATNVWMHHLEVLRADQVDEEVRGWLAAAYAAAR